MNVIWFAVYNHYVFDSPTICGPLFSYSTHQISLQDFRDFFSITVIRHEQNKNN